jgi:pyrroloquinoline quinone (PQQ) biosynthesis protein C
VGSTHHHFLESLVGELEGHPVNSNLFFQSFAAEHLSREQLQTFVRQYRYFCKHFVKLLEGLLFQTPVDQLHMRVELAKTLHSELGSGDPEQAHIALLDRFAASIGLTANALDLTIPLPEVAAYLTVLRRLFLESDHVIALGAETAVEVTAASEFRYFYPALRRYGEFSERDLAFFHLHLQEEEHHGQWLLQAVEKTATTEDRQQRIVEAARETADAWHRFWLGLYPSVFGKPVTHAA